MDARRRESLLKEYGEVSSSFRLLTDIRFKLLGFLPTAAAAGAIFKGDSASLTGVALSLFGLAATLGLVTYNARNNQLYNELVARAASIERSLGLPDGAFANRPAPWLTIRFPWPRRETKADRLWHGRWRTLRLRHVSWKVDHGTGVQTIYAATITFWVFGLLAQILEGARQAWLNFSLPHYSVPGAAFWNQIFALALAVLITFLCFRLVSRQKRQREKEMRADAVRAVTRALAVGVADSAEDAELIEACARLSGADDKKMRARAEYYAAVAPESLGYYLPRGAGAQTACHLVALLTDLPPQWLFDCFTNRRGSL